MNVRWTMINKIKYKIRQIFGLDGRFNIGEPCKWGDIAVGEVFGQKGCFEIYLKTGEDKKLLLDCDWSWGHIDMGGEWTTTLKNHIYKLPKETQELYYIPEED